MLRHLRVTNFAILSDVSLDLGPGLTALTGETGAGKSLIVDAVNLLRGGRASADIPRAGSAEAVVEAIFEVPDDLRGRVRARLVEAGIADSHDGGEVLVRRLIHRGGRSRVYINGALTTASRLAELGALLVDLSGQHQHQGLVDPRRHREILDEFADHGDLVTEMAATWSRVVAVEERVAVLEGGGARAERIDFLRFQLQEIDDAAPSPGEVEELARERLHLSSVDRLETGARTAWAMLYDDGGAAIERIDAAARELDRMLPLDERLGEVSRSIGEARALVEEAAGRLRAYADRLEGDPERLAAIEDRLALLRRLERKHGGSVADVLARAALLRRELDDLEGAEGRIEELAAERARALGDAEARAEELRRSRRAAAARLEHAVGAALAELGMGSAQLRVALAERELAAHGADQVELMLCANRGEEAKPLARVASGGELSRIMLALKLVLRRAEPVGTYVFDEVDAGIGGATAEVVGEKIRQVSRDRQVLCVTHLPQIAALADRHFRVSKTEVNRRTETAVAALDPEARRDELARMVGGRVVTAEARAHAEAMLVAAAAPGDQQARRATGPRRPRGGGAARGRARAQPR